MSKGWINCPDCGAGYWHRDLAFRHVLWRHGWTIKAAWQWVTE